MTLRDFIDDITDDELIYLKLCEYFANAYPFRRCRVNKLSKLLDCKVHSIGSMKYGDQIAIVVQIECEDLNDCKNFLNGVNYV